MSHKIALKNMEKPIIEAKNISKQYSLDQKLRYETLRDTVMRFVKNPFSLLENRKSAKNFPALQDISFEIQKGEAIGLIGPNGSGKSTLLKILSRITMPTTGEIKLRGNVASLLEIGTGFHHELTGRENIFLNGSILGMTKKEIMEKFDEIVEFSGVEKFLDTPVKRYSSGMIVRLAFAVAAHLDSDILIVDEVLAVGDSDFQKKSMKKMNEATREVGRTVIFVSHNMEAIKKLCTKCILLKSGKIEIFDTTNRVIEKYINKDNPGTISLVNGNLQNKKAGTWFTEIKITSLQDSNKIKSGDGLKIALKYKSASKEKINNARIIITIINEDLQPVLGFDSNVCTDTLNLELDPQGKIICETNKIHLIEGRYFVNIEFLIKGVRSDYVMMASELNISTDIHKYEFQILPDKSVCNYLIQYHFKQ